MNYTDEQINDLAEERKSGYYWVVRSDGIKCIAEWADYEWFFTGNEVGYPNTSIYEVLNYIGCDGIDSEQRDEQALILSDVSNLAKFCKKIAKQEDCPPEFIEIVNKEFWNLI